MLRRSTRALPVLVVAAVVAAVGYANRADLPAAVRAVRGADPGWLAVAAAMLVAWWLEWALVHAACRHAFGLPGYRELPHLVPPAVAAVALNSVVKSGGLAGLAVFAADARRRGVAAGRVTGGYLLSAVAVEAGFVVTLAAGIAVVWSDGRLTGAEIAACAVFLVVLGLRVALLVAAVRSREALRRLWGAPRRCADRLLRRPPGLSATAATAATAAADELYDAVRLVRARPAAVLPALAAAVGIDAFGAAMLWACLAAVGAGDRPVTALVAYAISVLFGIVGFLPGGLGFVEVGAAAVLVSLGVPVALAGAAVVLYRVFEFWLPLLAGSLTGWRLRRRDVARAGGSDVGQAVGRDGGPA